MNRGFGIIAGIGLLGLAACGDSAIVERCVKQGKSAKWCRCSDNVFRSELSSEEYRIAEKAANGDDRAVERAMKEKGVGFALTFGGKMAGAAAKISEKCGFE